VFAQLIPSPVAATAPAISTVIGVEPRAGTAGLTAAAAVTMTPTADGATPSVLPAIIQAVTSGTGTQALTVSVGKITPTANSEEGLVDHS
jgi:hypothetical protein